MFRHFSRMHDRRAEILNDIKFLLCVLIALVLLGLFLLTLHP